MCFLRVIVDRLRLNTAGTYCLTTVPLAVALNINRRNKFISVVRLQTWTLQIRKICGVNRAFSSLCGRDSSGRTSQQQQELPVMSTVTEFWRSGWHVNGAALSCMATKSQTGRKSLTLAVISCTTCYTIRYVLDGPKIKSRCGRDFPHPSSGPRVHPASCIMGTGYFWRG
jgi:hypothetical protein